MTEFFDSRGPENHEQAIGVLRSRRRLRDRDGSAVVSFRAGHWQNRPRATSVIIEQGTPEQAAALLGHQLPGWIAVTDDTLAAALAHAGADIRRRFRRYHFDLKANPPDPSWLRPRIATPLVLRPAADVPVQEIYELWCHAYAPGHPDRARYRRTDDALAEITDLWQGDLLGPMLPFSSVISDDQGSVAVMTAHALETPLITQMFRDLTPRGRGLPELLGRYALAAAAEHGLAGLGAAVTVGNRPSAVGLAYLGFQHIDDAADVHIPRLHAR